jgi:polysaccharide export outer membrane protein
MSLFRHAFALVLAIGILPFASAQQSDAANKSNAVPDASGTANATASTAGDKSPDTKTAGANATTDATANSETYKIGVGDELNVAVWHEPEVSGQHAVRPDGIITLPFLNEVYVAGKTTAEIRDMLTEKLKPYVTEPQVTVSIQSINSRKVYAIGNIGHSGAFPLIEPTSVLELIAQCGGLAQFAKGNKIYILRGQQRIPFDYKKAVKGDPSQHVMLMPGDMVVVP